MIDETNGYIIKSKLTMTVKTLSKYNDQSRLARKKTKKTYSETQKLTNIQVEIILKEEKYTLTNRRTSRLNVDTRKQRVKPKMKNESPYVLLLLK